MRKPLSKKEIINIVVSATLIIAFIYLLILNHENRKISNSLTKQLESWNIHSEYLQNFTIDNIETRKMKNSEITDLTAKRRGQIFHIRKITNLSEDSANRYIDDRKIQLKSIYEPIVSPYFAALTTEIECPEEFKPLYNESIHTNNKIIYYILYANERLSYGVCSKDLIKYKSILAFTYCEDTEDIYKLEYFIPDKEYNETAEEIIRSFSC